MKRLILACFLTLLCSFPLYALDDTDESGRKIDPAKGIERVVQDKLPNPPLFDAHFAGSLEKEFILFQWEPKECFINFNRVCLGEKSPRWKRVLGIVSSNGAVSGTGNVDCGSRLILTGWYRTDPASGWVQARTTIVSCVTGDKTKNAPVGVIARFEDGSNGFGTIEFIHGCSPKCGE